MDKKKYCLLLYLYLLILLFLFCYDIKFMINFFVENILKIFHFSQQNKNSSRFEFIFFK